MITLKTNNSHHVPFGRGVVLTEVYLKISDFQIDENGVIPHGYYYIIQQEQPHKLDDIVPSILSWEQIELAEQNLSDFGNKSLKEAIYKRATEFAFAKLQSEGMKNYNIAPTDWAIYIAPILAENEDTITQHPPQNEANHQ